MPSTGGSRTNVCGLVGGKDEVIAAGFDGDLAVVHLEGALAVLVVVGAPDAAFPRRPGRCSARNSREGKAAAEKDLTVGKKERRGSIELPPNIETPHHAADDAATLERAGLHPGFLPIVELEGEEELLDGSEVVWILVLAVAGEVDLVLPAADQDAFEAVVDFEDGEGDKVIVAISGGHDALAADVGPALERDALFLGDIEGGVVDGAGRF